MSPAASDSGADDAGQAMLASVVSRATRTMLVIDVTESVRLSEQDEEGTVRRWLKLIGHIEIGVLPLHGGRMVKDLGDGAMFVFDSASDAVSAAFAIQDAAARHNVGVPPDRQMMLRIGIETGNVFLNQDNVFGRSAIVAQRLGTLAGPGESVVSATVRELLTPALDAEVEDLGECYVKHVSQPLRAYRVGPPGPNPVLQPWVPSSALTPTIAVVPFSMASGDPTHRLVGEVLAEEVIGGLARSSELTVISRLSTTVFRDREAGTSQVGVHLSAQYVLSGSYRVENERIRLSAELAEAASGRIVWTQRFADSVSAIMAGEQSLIGELISEVSSSIMSSELQRARNQSLPTLKGYTLLMAAIALMHRLSESDFQQARIMLETLLDRSKRQPIPQAWLGKWHVLRVQQGWSPDEGADARMALRHTQQALDVDPACSLALTVDGLAHTNLLKRFDIAEERYDLAIQANPNDSFAWLLRGMMHGFMSKGTIAVAETQRALMLSPLDPHRYFYDALAASAYNAAGQYTRGLELAKRSLRANRTHTSTLRTLAVSQVRLGLGDEARETVRQLLRLEPGLTISRWLERSPAASFATGKDWSAALRTAGVPE